MKRAALLALLAALAGAAAQAQIAQKPAQQAQEQRQGDPQAQEEQAGKAALQPQRKPDAQPVKGQPQGKPAKEQHKPRKPPQRRAVPAIIGSMPAPSAPPSYGPVLGTPPVPATPQAYAPLPGTPPPAPQANGQVLGTGPSRVPGAAAEGVPPPAAITQCVGPRCTDAAGRNYQIGVGNAGTDSNGRLCNRSGNTVQCF